MNKQTIAVIGILQIVLGLVLAYQAGFASGGIFSPQTLKPNDIFYGSSNYMYADFNPTSATISTGGSQTFTIVLYDNGGQQLDDSYANFNWLVDGTTVSSGGAGMESYSVSGLGVGTHSVECDATNFDYYNEGWDSVSCTATLTVTGQATPPPASYTAFIGDGTEVGTATLTVQDLTRGTSTAGMYGISLPIASGDTIRFSAIPPQGYGFAYWTGNAGTFYANPATITATGSISEDVYYGIVTNPTPTPVGATPTPTPRVSASPRPSPSTTPSVTYNVHMVGYQQAGIGGFSWNPQGTFSGGTDTWTFNSGTIISLSATAFSGYTFDHWLINGVQYVGSNGQWQITSTTTIQAVFLSNSATPRPTPSGNPQASPTPTPMPLPTATPYNPNATPTPYQNYPTSTPRVISSAELSTFVLFAVGVSLVCSGLLTTGFSFKANGSKRKP